MSRQNLLVGAASAAFLSAITPALAQSNSTTDLETVTVTAQRLEQARVGIQTQLGASTYTVTAAGHCRTCPAATICCSIGDPADAQRGAGFLRPIPYPRRAQCAAIPHRRHHPAGRHQRLRPDPGPPAGAIGPADHRRACPPNMAWTPAASSISRPRPACSTPAVMSPCMAAATTRSSPASTMAARPGSFNYFVSGDYNTNSLGIESPDQQPHPAA